ncbi:MAG: hypothetical protein ACKO26_17220 [Planctomycetota bacterium]
MSRAFAGCGIFIKGAVVVVKSSQVIGKLIKLEFDVSHFQKLLEDFTQAVKERNRLSRGASYQFEFSQSFFSYRENRITSGINKPNHVGDGIEGCLAVESWVVTVLQGFSRQFR